MSKFEFNPLSGQFDLVSDLSGYVTISSLTKTPGSVLFAGSDGLPTQDNPNFFWDNTNKRFGLGVTPRARIDSVTPIAGSGSGVATTLPSGTWAAIFENRNNTAQQNGIFASVRYQDSTTYVLDVGTTNHTTGAYTSSFKVNGLGVATFGAAFSTIGITVPYTYPSAFTFTKNSSGFASGFLGDGYNTGLVNEGITIGNRNTGSVDAPILSVNSGVTYTGTAPTGSGTNRFIVKTTGNVGMGTTTPSGYSSNIVFNAKGATTNFGSQSIVESNDGTQHLNFFSGLGGADAGAAIIFKGSKLRIASETGKDFTGFVDMLTLNSSGLLTSNYGISAGTTSTYGAITAVGGTSFAGTLPALGTASIGRVITSGWDGSGFVFTNSISGSKAFSMVYNADRAYFGQLTTSGYVGDIMATWDAVGFNIGTVANPVNRLGVNGGTSIGASYVSTTAPTNGLLVEGNVGIGTSTPTYPLVTSLGSGTGDISFASVTSNPFILLNNTNPAATLGSGIRFQKNGVNKFGFGIDYSGNGGQNWWVYDYVANAARILVDSSGNVGIGTSSPLRKLQVGDGIPSSVDTTNLNTVTLVGSAVSTTDGKVVYNYISSTYGIIEAYDYVNTVGLPLQFNPNGAKVSFGGVANLKNYTVATLPAGTRGDVAYVTDALAPTFLGALVGGGAIVTPVFYNGAAWVAY